MRGCKLFSNSNIPFTIRVDQDQKSIYNFIRSFYKPNQQIIYECNFGESVLGDYNKEKGEDALIYTNTALMSKQRDVLSFLLKKVGQNIFSGKSVMSISLPITVFERRSFLERYVCDNVGFTKHIREAYLAKKPLDKIKHV